MEHVRLGGTGLHVSRICLGMMSYGDPGWRDWVLGEDDAEPFVRRAPAVGWGAGAPSCHVMISCQ